MGENPFDCIDELFAIEEPLKDKTIMHVRDVNVSNFCNEECRRLGYVGYRSMVERHPSGTPCSLPLTKFRTPLMTECDYCQTNFPEDAPPFFQYSSMKRGWKEGLKMSTPPALGFTKPKCVPP